METIDQPYTPRKQSFFAWLTTPPMTKQKIAVLATILLIAIAIAGGAFWFTLEGSSTTDASQTPTPTLATSVTPTSLVSPTELPSPTSTLTPTKKPSNTPTITPTRTPTPTASSTTKTLTATSALDGFQSNNGGGNTTADIRAGRNVNLVTRGFVSFHLGSIPSGATIEQATLRLYQTSVDGNPYTAGGDLKIDHLTYGESLENADYSSAAISASFTTLTNSASAGWKEVDVTDRLRDDVQNTRANSQYRLHFATENTGGDETGDFSHFEAADTGSGNIPQLLVRYH